jgi:sphinganine-1-phosphate aldolase
MTARGWLTGHVRNPPGLHLMLNLTHEPVVGEYLADLAASQRDAVVAGAGDALKPVY